MGDESVGQFGCSRAGKEGIVYRETLGSVWCLFPFLEVLQMVKFWLIFVTVKFAELLYPYVSWLCEALASPDVLHTVLNSEGLFFLLKWSYNNF